MVLGWGRGEAQARAVKSWLPLELEAPMHKGVEAYLVWISNHWRACFCLSGAHQAGLSAWGTVCFVLSAHERPLLLFSHFPASMCFADSSHNLTVLLTALLSHLPRVREVGCGDSCSHLSVWVSIRIFSVPFPEQDKDLMTESQLFAWIFYSNLFLKRRCKTLAPGWHRQLSLQTMPSP